MGIFRWPGLCYRDPCYRLSQVWELGIGGSAKLGGWDGLSILVKIEIGFFLMVRTLVTHPMLGPISP